MQLRIHPLMVEMRPYDHILIGYLSRDCRQHIGKIHRTILQLLYLGNGIRFHIIARTAVKHIHATCLKRLHIGITN